MCDLVIPILLGVGALALLTGGNQATTCAPATSADYSHYAVTVPQQQAANYQYSEPQQYSYAQPGYAASAPAYQAAPAPAVDAGGYVNPNGVGVNASVGGVGVSTDVGARSY